MKNETFRIETVHSVTQEMARALAGKPTGYVSSMKDFLESVAPATAGLYSADNHLKTPIIYGVRFYEDTALPERTIELRNITGRVYLGTF